MNMFSDLIVPIILALIGGGVIKNYFDRNKTSAETRKTDAETDAIVADGWEKYAKNLEARITNLELLMAVREKEHQKVVVEKDLQIQALNKRIDDLEDELVAYKANKEFKAEEAKVELHEAVDKNLEAIKEA